MPSINPTVSTNGGLVSEHERKIAAADAADTILARTRILSSKKAADAIAADAGLTAGRYELIERGIIDPSASEQRAIRKAVGSSSPVLFEKQTPETRAAETSRF